MMQTHATSHAKPSAFRKNALTVTTAATTGLMLYSSLLSFLPQQVKAADVTATSSDTVTETTKANTQADSAQTTQQDIQAGQAAAQQDVLTGNGQGTSIPAEASSTYKDAYHAEYTKDLADYQVGQASAKKDVQQKLGKGASLAKEATIYQQAGYAAEYPLAHSTYQSGYNDGYSVGFRNGNKDQAKTSQDEIYLAGFETGYQTGKKEANGSKNNDSSNQNNTNDQTSTDDSQNNANSSSSQSDSTASQAGNDHQTSSGAGDLLSQGNNATSNGAASQAPVDGLNNNEAQSATPEVPVAGEATNPADSFSSNAIQHQTGQETPGATQTNNGFSSVTGNSDLDDILDDSIYSDPYMVPTHEQFIKQIAKEAQKIAFDNDLYASVMIAQASLESGWGSSALSQSPNFNLFGVKGTFNGKSANMLTQEDDGSGHLYTIKSAFKKYGSYKDSLNDYKDLLRGKNGMSSFYAGTWKDNTTSYKEATKYLTGRYATDTSYNKKLNAIIKTYNLTQYDQQPEPEVNFVKASKQSSKGNLVALLTYTARPVAVDRTSLAQATELTVPVSAYSFI